MSQVEQVHAVLCATLGPTAALRVVCSSPLLPPLRRILEAPLSRDILKISDDDLVTRCIWSEELPRLERVVTLCNALVICGLAIRWVWDYKSGSAQVASGSAQEAHSYFFKLDAGVQAKVAVACVHASEDAGSNERVGASGMSDLWLVANTQQTEWDNVFAALQHLVSLSSNDVGFCPERVPKRLADFVTTQSMQNDVDLE